MKVENKLVKNDAHFLYFVGRIRENTSTLMWRFSSVAKLAPKKPTHKTRCLRNVSPQRILDEKKFLKMTCRNAKNTMIPKESTRTPVSIRAKIRSILCKKFTGCFSKPDYSPLFLDLSSDKADSTLFNNSLE